MMMELDLRETGRDIHGNTIYAEQRLYMQLLAFGDCPDPRLLVEALSAAGLPGALYTDLNDPQGVVLVTAHSSPDFFITELRECLQASCFADCRLKPEYTMFGRTYSIGYEADLEHVLLRRPLQRMLNPDTPWAVWYPVRRKSHFAQLSDEEQREILSEHGRLGASFSAGAYGQDIRLACYGLDKNDNDFIIGLVGADLFPLSAMVQAMRKTRQTAEFLDNLGPFIIGKAIWQSTVPESV